LPRHNSSTASQLIFFVNRNYVRLRLGIILVISGGSLLNITISEKLTRENVVLWQTQVLPEIYGAQLYGYLDGSIEAPEKETTVKDKDGVEVTISYPDYARWVVQDQSVLGFLVQNMDKEVLTQMAGLRTSAAV
jgi:hypothetical protein